MKIENALKFALSALLISSCAYAAEWKPAGDKIMTKWAEAVDPANVLPEYPRPLMQRVDWMNLNGLWDYAIVNKDGLLPENFDGKILVPFPLESALSGVGKRISDRQSLWYAREFEIPQGWEGREVLVNFGGVDWKAEVFVNGEKAGEHSGGYAPFSFNITKLLKKGKNRLNVRVWDPTDRHFGPRGKQVSTPNGIWYTPVSGIWQTVWLEPVSKRHFERIKTTPDLDKGLFVVQAFTNAADGECDVEIEILDADSAVASARGKAGEALEIKIENAKAWSPKSPFLYGMNVRLSGGGKTFDEVKSYAGMRKFSMEKDAKGIFRFKLNNEFIFHYGPLDQGWWPDGLYTAPSDEALAFDIEKTKQWGYNMIRKHVKVEPARWYYHADRIGLIVWQDMPNASLDDPWVRLTWYDEGSKKAQGEKNFFKEWKEVMDFLYSQPCIGVWVPFNEAWGQFKTDEIAKFTKDHDPTRLVNSASGGNHFKGVGDILDLHNYPNPAMFLFDPTRACVLGEYGGLAMIPEGHTWNKDKNWGYGHTRTDAATLVNDYVKHAEELIALIPKGFTAAVYTQTTDVEIEVNGIMSYDRKVVKMDEAKLRQINERVINSMEK